MRLLTVREAAARLGIGPGAVRGLLRAGRLNPIRVGTSERGKVLIAEGEVLGLSLTGRVPAGDEIQTR